MQLQNLADRQDFQETKICISEPLQIIQGHYLSSGHVMDRQGCREDLQTDCIYRKLSHEIENSNTPA